MYSDCSKIDKLKEVKEVTTIPKRSPHTLIYRMTDDMKMWKFALLMDSIQTEIYSTLSGMFWILMEGLFAFK